MAGISTRALATWGEAHGFLRPGITATIYTRAGTIWGDEATAFAKKETG